MIVGALSLSLSLSTASILQINYGHVRNTFPKEMVQFCVTPHTSTLHPIVCLPSSGDILMFEMLTGKKINKLQGHFGQVTCLLAHHTEQVYRQCILAVYFSKNNAHCGEVDNYIL